MTVLEDRDDVETPEPLRPISRREARGMKRNAELQNQLAAINVADDAVNGSVPLSNKQARKIAKIMDNGPVTHGIVRRYRNKVVGVATVAALAISAIKLGAFDFLHKPGWAGDQEKAPAQFKGIVIKRLKLNSTDAESTVEIDVDRVIQKWRDHRDSPKDKPNYHETQKFKDQTYRASARVVGPWDVSGDSRNIVVKLANVQPVLPVTTLTFPKLAEHSRGGVQSTVAELVPGDHDTHDTTIGDDALAGVNKIATNTKVMAPFYRATACAGVGGVSDKVNALLTVMGYPGSVELYQNPFAQAVKRAIPLRGKENVAAGPSLKKLDPNAPKVKVIIQDPNNPNATLDIESCRETLFRAGWNNDTQSSNGDELTGYSVSINSLTLPDMVQ